jgi:hypothetical protein
MMDDGEEMNNRRWVLKMLLYSFSYFISEWVVSYILIYGANNNIQVFPINVILLLNMQSNKKHL